MGQSVVQAPRRLWLLAALALAGVGLNVALSQHYYEVRNGTAAFHSFCNIDKKMNCDVIAASPWAELVAGIPLSSFAAGWFLALFFVALLARNPFWRREGLRAAALITAIGSLFSVAYFGIMAGVIGTYCLLCLFVDAANLAALATVLSLRPEGLSVHKPERAKWKTLAGIAAASLALGVLGLRTLDNLSLPASAMEEMAGNVLNSPAVSVNAGAEFPSIGPADAPITIVEFSDFQCPFCRMAAFSLNSVFERYAGKVRIVFRNYPLDSSCNHKMEHSVHQFACEAARTAICANKQGKFEDTYQLLFENQASFAPGRPEELAKQAGANGDQLMGCVSSPETAVAVQRDIEEGNVLNVQSTPTIFVNGHRAEGALPAPVWGRIIDTLLAQRAK